MTTLVDAPKKSRRVAPIVFLVLAVALVALIFGRYKEAVTQRAAFAEQPVANATEEATAARITDVTHGVTTEWKPSLALAGTLSPIQDSNLSFKVSGRLASVDVEVGDVVKQGQRLASLDAADAAAQVNSANAQVHAAEVELEIARDSEQRSRALMTQGAVSDSQHRADAQRVQLAQARLDQARAQVAMAVTAQGNTRMLAPFAGRITLAPSAPGEVVSPGTTLVRIEDTSALRLRATLSVEDATLAKVGAPIAIEGHSATGKITAVLPSVDAQTRRVPIVAEIANDSTTPLLAGVFVRATLSSDDAPITVVKLPAEALRAGSQDEIVLVQDGKAKVTRISFVHGEGGALLVRQGVSEGDVVVLNPVTSTKTGDALTLRAQK